VTRWLVLLGIFLSLAGPATAWGQAGPRGRPSSGARPQGPPAEKATPAPPTKAKPAGSIARPAVDDNNAPVTVDADQLENLQKEGLIVFTGNVVASQNSSTQYADRMEVYLDPKGDTIVRTISTGNVRIITKDCRMGTAKRAEYYDAEQRVVLIGNARVWREDNVVTGERITMYLAEDRSVVEGGKQERVKAVFYPKSQDQPQKPESRAASAVPCG
jgi:lipopolysaccharide export system protein LptA